MKQERRVLKNIKPYPARYRERYLKLDMNENFWGPSPKVEAALQKIKAEDLIFYPESEDFVKQLASYHNIPKEMILITSGADEAIRCSLEAIIDPGDNVLLPVPTYSMFSIYLTLREAEVKEIEFKSSFEFPQKDVLTCLKKGNKALIVVNPASPTGGLIEQEKFAELLEAAGETVIIADETYADFAGYSAVKFLKQYSNLLIIRSFSKAMGLAGMRLGYILGDKELIEGIEKINPPYPV